MAGKADARKVFNFRIEIQGVDQLLIQTVKRPEIELGAVEHGGDDMNIKTAGGMSVSDAELTKIMDLPNSDNWGWNWLTSARGSLAANYKRDVIFKEMHPDGVTPLSIELWKGAWCKKLTKSDFKRGVQNENTMETATISVDEVVKIL